jgi:hypothetical protein
MEAQIEAVWWEQLGVYMDVFMCTYVHIYLYILYVY